LEMGELSKTVLPLVSINLGFAYLLIDKVIIGREITRKRVSVNADTIENKLYAL